ncbi:MAG: hypothetical protein KJI69_03715 [Patescibacteria group bacterium]|nr:hypothetical protein [Patescibacteria group bacterium]
MGETTLLTRGFKDSKGKFHPITQYKGVRSRRDTSTKTQGVRLQRQSQTTITPKFATDVSEKISRRFGRGTHSTGFFNIIDKYNAEHPQSQIDYSNSGLDGLDMTITEYTDEEVFHGSLRIWKVWIEKPENKPIKDIINKMQIEVDAYNKLTDEKYKKTNVFYRGTDMYEIDNYIDEGILGSDFDSDFDFVSLTMNPSQAKATFNEGVSIMYNADSIRNSGDANKVNYSMDFFPVLAVDFERGSDLGSLEPIRGKQNALFVDEQEIRVDKDMQITPKDITRITYYPDKIGYSTFIRYIEDPKLTRDFKAKTVNDKAWIMLNKTEIANALKKKLGDFGDGKILIDFESRMRFMEEFK